MSVTLLELERHHCRWPLPDGKFCGCRRERGAYCEKHAKRAYLDPIEESDDE